MLKAVLLAQEQFGVIRLEFDELADRQDSLIVIPTGTRKEWPPATLEARLLVNKRSTASEVVREWLGEDSPDPWRRAAEQGKIMLVLRGIAALGLSRWGTRRYS